MSSSAPPDQPRRGPGFWISAWLPVAIACGVIAVESTRFMGADHTTGPLRGIWEWFFGVTTDARWEVTHHLIRKTGHFVGYGLVGLAWLRGWRKTFPSAAFLRHALLALAGTALIAGSDEFHQSFLPNRTASRYDVLLDCTGAAVMMCGVWLIRRIRSPKSPAQASPECLQ